MCSTIFSKMALAGRIASTPRCARWRENKTLMKKRGRSDRPVAAVRHHDRASDISRQIGSEEDRGARDVFWLAGAAERRVIEKDLHQLGIVGAHLCVERRLNEARTDRVHAYAVLAKFGRERAGKAEDAMFCRGVGWRVRRAHMHERLDRSNIDDPALGRTQGIEKRMGYVEHPVEIDRHDVLPVLDGGVGFGSESVAAVDAGIVDQD